MHGKTDRLERREQPRGGARPPELPHRAPKLVVAGWLGVREQVTHQGKLEEQERGGQ